MRSWFERFKPAVSSRVLIALAGLMWLGAGTMLVVFAAGWLGRVAGARAWWLAAGGAGLALLIHHFGLLRLVDRNLGRIRSMAGKRCLFGFQPWRSYAMIAVMITLGVLLRRSGLNRAVLAVAYLAMGGGLILSSLRYLRVFVQSLAQG